MLSTESEPLKFADVLHGELQEIRAARLRRLKATAGEGDIPSSDTPEAAHLIGLALSSGGLRSATFGLGALQGLARTGFLRRLDYISAVGGGSHIAGWLAGWITRAGFDGVEAALGSRRVGPDAAEAEPIHQLRRRTTALLSGWASNPRTRLIFVRNVLLNLSLLASLLGAVMLAGTGLFFFAVIDSYHPRYGAFIVDWAAGVAAALFFAVTSVAWRKPVAGQRALYRPALVAALVIAATLLAVANTFFPEWTPIEVPGAWLLSGLWLSVPFLVAFLPDGWRLRAIVKHVPSSVLAGAIVSVGMVIARQLPEFAGQYALATSIILLFVVVAAFVHVFCMGPNVRQSTHNLLRPVSGALVIAAVCFCLTALAWSAYALSLTIGIAILTLGVGAFLLVSSRVARKGLPALLAQSAPYLFLLAMFLVTSIPLRLAIEAITLEAEGRERLLSGELLVDLLGAAFLLLLARLLSWRMGENEFSLSALRRTLLVKTYLMPSRSRRNTEAQETDAGADLRLDHLTVEDANYCGPYPLFGASTDLVDDDRSDLRQRKTLPFLLASRCSGYEDPGSVHAYRATREFRDPLLLGTAMAISDETLLPRPSEPSPATAFLSSILSFRAGWWLRNTLLSDHLRRRIPRLGLVRSWFATFRGASADAQFLHVKAASGLDNLGIFELVKRHCALILVCDAVDDRNLTFEHVGDTIKRCRTDLGVEIDLELTPFRLRDDAALRTHYQVGVIRYPRGDFGLLLYMRPSLTGDELADVQQHAAAQQSLPLGSESDAFDETDFESYRWLGQHVIESLLKTLSGDSFDHLGPADLIAYIRGRLQQGSGDPVSGPAIASPSKQQPLPAGLVDAVRSGNAVLWAGPGLAAQSGLPDWGGFLRDLLAVAKSGGQVDDATATGLEATLTSDGLDTVADELSHRLPREAIVERMNALVKNVEPSQAHKLVAQLPFAGAVNTNFDALLERAFAEKQPQTLTLADADNFGTVLRTKNFFLMNVLGDPRRTAPLVLTLKDFRMLLNANPALKQFLVTLFLRYQVIFVGTSVKGIRDYLDALELSQNPEQPHYAIVADTGLNPVELRYLQRTYSVEVFPYRPVERYPELPALLRQLRTGVDAHASVDMSAGAAAVLDRVTLTNIGPFESLSITLTPSWNLLLGDNGMGKTVILRAIAAALSGEAAPADVVSRLLRTGAQSGSIVLSVGKRDHKVELKREKDGTVHIASTGLSPLELDNWLALGFPALRSVPWERPEGPAEPKSAAPSPNDLLPLLTGRPDDRLATLKQWLINLDYAGGRKGEQAGRARAVLKRFFEVMRRLTPGLRLEFSDVDDKTMAIMVETDAGVVPLEAISQGTGSVMAWIGTLVQRMDEVAATAPPSGSRRPLVLIDELDAHMHPQWQRLFVDAFRDLFAVQIVATSHSPLLVGSLTRDEIWHMHRVPLAAESDGIVRVGPVERRKREIIVVPPQDDESATDASERPKHYEVPAGVTLRVKDGEVVEKGEHLTDENVRLVLERPDTDLLGWRADQILTGPLFRLDAARDPQTEALLKDYTRLTALDTRTADQETKLEEHARALRIRLPSPQEREIARQAYDVIHKSAIAELEKLSADKREEILEEVKVQVTESVTGSRRPA